MDMKKSTAAAVAEAEAEANHRRDASIGGEQNSEPSSMASEDTAAERESGGAGGGGAAGQDHDMAEAAASIAASASASGKIPSRQRQSQRAPARAARAPPAAAARRRRRAGNAARDIVLLNVGGTVFTTSAATLTSDSSYFKSMFSDRWASEEDQRDDDDDGDGDEAMIGMGNGGGDGGEYISAGPSAADVGIHRGAAPALSFSAAMTYTGYGGRPSCPTCNPQQDHYGQHHHFVPRPEPIFIDQDARPFSLLLTYMRGGGINLLESDVPLARQVMLQAQFFGVEGFLRVVKARAYRHNFEDFTGSDDKAVANFDKTYGGLDEAISEGILPDAYFRPMPDHVVINAGGTTFETSKRTLTERSPYFESLFKRSPRERTYFLDVDPSAFGILLKYMRHAEFDLPRSNVALFRCVLALAQRFEIRGFIEYVKARTYAIQSGHDPREWLTFLDRHHHPIEDSDNADAFNENYEGVDEAFVTGILPDGFFEKRET